MYGLDPGIALGCIGLYGKIRETRVYIYLELFSPNAWVTSFALAHRIFTFFHIWFHQNQHF